MSDMRKATLKTGLLLLAVIGLEGCTESSRKPEAVFTEDTDDFRATAGEFGPRDDMPGAALYTTHCNHCHDGTVPKAPHIVWLELMTPKTILAAMNEGIMQQQSSHLTDEERRHITEYLTLTPADSDTTTAIPWCENRSLSAEKPPAAIGWGHDTSRYTSLAYGGIEKALVPGLKLKWSFVFPGALRARSQPSVGYEAIYAGSQDGTVYAFDLETGCVKWTFEASAEVRTGIVLTNDGPPLALFGDILAKLYAVNALTGELVWQQKVDDHPSATLTGTPAYYLGNIYVPVSSLEVTAAADPAYPCCSFRGSILAMNAANGEELWRHYTIPTVPEDVNRTNVGTPVLAPSGAPVWSSPTVDVRRNRLYVGTGENYSSPADANSDAVIAINMETGERVWQRQSTAGDAWNVACVMEDNPNCPAEEGPDFDHGSSILLVKKTNGDEVLAAGHKDGSVLILDPDNGGELLWSKRLGRGSIQGGVHFGLAAVNGAVYVPINDMNDTRNGQFLDPNKARPGVSGIDIDEEATLWQYVQPDNCGDNRPFCDPGVSAPLSVSDGVVYAGHLDGELRAYDAISGRVIWSYDTTQAHTGVNGIEGRGGSMSGSGPTIAAGHMIVNSGYGLYYHEPGNLLLVFSPGTN